VARGLIRNTLLADDHCGIPRKRAANKHERENVMGEYVGRIRKRKGPSSTSWGEKGESSDLEGRGANIAAGSVPELGKRPSRCQEGISGNRPVHRARPCDDEFEVKKKKRGERKKKRLNRRGQVGSKDNLSAKGSCGTKDL